MKLFNYRTATVFEIRKELEARLELTDYQKSKIVDVLEDLPYRFIEFVPAARPKLINRLTAPFYFIFYLLLVFNMPFKWFFTGNIYYNSQSKLFVFLNKWHKSLGF